MPKTFREDDVTRRPSGAQKAGKAAGGQFADHIRSNPEVLLSATSRPDVMTQLSARRRALIQAGYIPAGSGIADGDPRKTDGIRVWWETHFNRSEVAPEGSYHQMPDDYTPNMTSGHALSEHRRTHRMLYQGAGVALRMPSAAAIKRYSAEIGAATFDVPVEATYPGGSVSGFVRITNNGPGAWSVSGVNLPDRANEYVSEAVSAVLENRRPSVALRQVRSLLVRRRERIAAAGVKVKPIEHSTWIDGMGFNESNNEMVLSLGGRMYGYKVSKQKFAAARDSWSPGQVYNQLVKGKSRRFSIEYHEVCGRYFNANKQHRCPSQHRQRTDTVKLHNLRVRKHLVGAAAAA